LSDNKYYFPPFYLINILFSMNIKFIIPKLLLFLCLFCVSCTKEIEIDTRLFEKKVVVNSLFTPGKPFLFHFSYSVSPVDSFSVFTDSIHLLLYENNTKILDTKFLSNSLLTSVYPQYNASYLLKVYVEGYDTIYAYDTISRKVGITEATIIQPISIDKYGTYISQASITFSDPAGERNYYELFLGDGGYDFENETTDPVLINEGDISYYPNSYFFSDELFDGQTYTMTINKSLGSGMTVKSVLRNISRNYYMYRKYWARHFYNQIGFDKEIGYLIYMGEPQAMFNSIVNGYGVFAGYVDNEPFALRKINE